MPQPPLNYETPKRGTSGAAAFWATFIASAIAGLVFATVIDNLIYHARTGRYPDGGASIISVLGIPLAALVAALVRALRKPKQTTWWVAACCGIAAAPVTVALLYAIW